MSDQWWNSAQLHETIPNRNDKIALYGAIYRQVWTSEHKMLWNSSK